MNLLGRYNSWLKSQPVLSRTATSFVIAFSGDMISQYIESKIDNVPYLNHFSLRRSLSLAGYTSVVITPFFHYWFIFLNKHIPGTSFVPLMKKFLLDRLLVPFPMVMGIFVSQTLMNGGTWQDVKDRVKHNYLTAMKMNLMVWPLAVLINFRFVSLAYQVLFMNTVGFHWNIYLSYSIHKLKLRDLEFLHQTD